MMILAIESRLNFSGSGPEVPWRRTDDYGAGKYLYDIWLFVNDRQGWREGHVRL